MGRGASTIEAQAAPRSRGYDPEETISRCRVIDDGPFSLTALPEQRAYELDQVFDARGYGRIDRASYSFRLIEVPLSELTTYRIEDLEQTFREMIEADDAWEAMTRDGEDPGFEHVNGRERYAITKEYVEKLRAGEELDPVVIDFYGLDDRPDVLDGYHRLAAAFETGVERIRAFELMVDED